MPELTWLQGRDIHPAKLIGSTPTQGILGSRSPWVLFPSLGSRAGVLAMGTGT
jgi:hypothetical protein